MRCSEARGTRRRGERRRGERRGRARRPRADLVLALASLLVLTLTAGAAAQEAELVPDLDRGGGASALVEVEDAFVPGGSGGRIVPEPREIAGGAGPFVLTPRTAVVLHADTPALREAAARFRQDVTVRHAFRPRIVAAAEAPADEPAVRVGILGRPDAPTVTAAPVARPEGYVLEVGPEGVTILGADERGAFYGLQSLRQLLDATPAVRGVVVRDWPELPWRIAMVYLDASSDEVNGRLLPILAQLKYNAVLIMSNYVRWESAPELHVPLGAPREAAERLAATARANLLEPIPLLETLGHAEWFFANGANAELRGDPDAPRAFVMDPLNPGTYRELLPILDEVVDLFDPRYVHVGHDEVRNVGTFPATPAQRAVGFGRLFRDDVARLHAHLARRGVGTMIWDDELVTAEVRPYWDDLPDDLVVASWRYVPSGAYPRLEQVHEAGFATLGASWFEPDNIESMARAVDRVGAAGLIQTRWTGYFGNVGMLRGAYRQVYAYVTAAAAAWNPAAGAPLAAPARFREAWLAQAQGGPRPGALVDLAGPGNRSLAAGPFGLEHGYALDALLETDERIGGVRYALGSAVALRGSHPRARELPERARIGIGRTARAVAFLHATGWYAAPGEEVGRYEVVYADGTRATVPLVYGRDIAAWTQTEVDTIDLEQPWQGLTPNGLRVAAYAMRWRNPRPETPIDRIEFVTADGIAAPMLLGLTLLD